MESQKSVRNFEKSITNSKEYFEVDPDTPDVVEHRKAREKLKKLETELDALKEGPFALDGAVSYTHLTLPTSDLV